MEFSRPEYWSGQLFPSPGDLPNLGTEPRSPALQEDSLPAEPQVKQCVPCHTKGSYVMGSVSKFFYSVSLIYFMSISIFISKTD